MLAMRAAAISRSNVEDGKASKSPNRKRAEAIAKAQEVSVGTAHRTPAHRTPSTHADKLCHVITSPARGREGEDAFRKNFPPPRHLLHNFLFGRTPDLSCALWGRERRKKTVVIYFIYFSHISLQPWTFSHSKPPYSGAGRGHSLAADRPSR